MIKKITKNKRGFVILFAVTISSILLAIALGISNISMKEVKFSTSAKNTNEAFFAADTGIEYALFHDKEGDYLPAVGMAQTWDFNVYAANGGGVSCAKVSVTKDNTSLSTTTTSITSKGYNIGDETCSSSNPDRIERELTITY